MMRIKIILLASIPNFEKKKKHFCQKFNKTELEETETKKNMLTVCSRAEKI